MLRSLQDKVTVLPGIGEKKAQLLKKLGIETLEDLLHWFPRRYVDRRKIWPIRHAPEGEEVCVCGVVAQPPTTAYPRKGLSTTRLRVFDRSGLLYLTFFNQAYTAGKLKVGESYIFCGKIEQMGQRLSMTNPVFEAEGVGEITGRIVPVYPLTSGISARQLSEWIDMAVEQCALLPEDLPQTIRTENGLAERNWSIQTIHRPNSFEDLSRARERLVFEELFYLTAGLELLHARRKEGEGFLCRSMPTTDYEKLLPFTLTGAQRRTLEEIFRDQSSGKIMNRLVQGDVGSGKTAVAAGAVWQCVHSGGQCALMAPTEILATQHYHTLTELLAPDGIRVGLLTGSTKAAEKRQVKQQLAEGTLDLVVGTHALISDGVEFANLGLVITDEQHRFGVEQRSALSAKAGTRKPHVLVMSATPIPRTLALIIYGDLDVSVIGERPPGRQDVDTFLVGEDKRQRMMGFIRKQVQEGHQAYVVCPAVEESEETTVQLKNATDHARTLQQAFPDLRIGLIHGRMKPKEKEQIMDAFLCGEVDVLVSTTVIEVGVDAPNATLMVIEDADRFGLSQLHQLRGRVGRGNAKSFCVLVSSTKNEETRQRLKALCRTNDGFKIAEKDLELRGPGDFFGARQHGLPQLQMADLACDTRILYQAREAAQKLLEEDPELEKPEHHVVLERTRKLFEENPDIFN